MMVYHFLYFGYEKTVIDSQVLTPAVLLSAENINVHIVFLERLDRYVLKKVNIPSFAKSITYSVLPRMPRNFLFLNTSLVFFYFLMRKMINGPLVIHARGLQGAALLLSIKRWLPMRLVADVRGLESEEYAYSVRKGLPIKLNFIQDTWKRHLEFMARRVIHGADRLLFVSKSMAAYYQPAENWQHVPCAVETQRYAAPLSRRTELRSKLDLDGKCVVAYTGGNRLWQGIDEVARLFSHILKREPLAVFLGLTHERGELRDAFAKVGVPDELVHIYSVSYDQIPDYLVCADVGLLLRDRHLLNQYACPTKFAEYLAAGLHVVTTNSIIDIVELIRSENVGTVIDDLSSNDEVKEKVDCIVRAAVTGDRILKSTRVAEKYFDWTNYISRLKRVYQS